MSLFRQRHFSGAPLVALGFALALMAGCASIPKEILETEPSSYLEFSPQLYVRLSGDALRDMAAGMSNQEMASIARAISPKAPGGYSDRANGSASGKDAPPLDTSMLDSFLAKTSTFGAGIRGIDTGSPAMEAVFLGNFPVASVRIALTLDGNWQKSDDGGYRSVKYPIFLRPPQPGLIHASSIESPPRMDLGRIEAYPNRFEELADSDVFIAANAPAAFFSSPIPMEAASIPVSSIIVTGHRLLAGAPNPGAAQANGTGSRYLLDIKILMKDEASARAYKPVVRFLWTAAISKLFGDALDVSALPLVLENDIYAVRGIDIDSARLRAMLTAPLLGN